MAKSYEWTAEAGAPEGDRPIRLNLETDSSEVDNILISYVNFRYKTAQARIEI